MTPDSPIPVIVAFLLAIGTAHFLPSGLRLTAPGGRFATLDGLRGYLAIGVFVHHSRFWYFYVRSGVWTTPDSALYTHLGQSSVILFFMITGFLFFGKILNARTRQMDWGRLFVSRVLRLAPLYALAMLLLLSIVVVLSHGELHGSPVALAKGVFRWLTFTIVGSPDLNGVPDTKLIIAGVTWSLVYEWLFYLSLPLLACAVGAIPPLAYVAMSGIFLLAIALVMHWGGVTDLLLGPAGRVFTTSFAGGMLAAVAVRSEWFARRAEGKVMTAVVLGCVLAAVFLFPAPHSLVSVCLLAIAFTLIAGGNSLLGLLHRKASRVLGEMAYSIYLLHGILLFTLFTFVVGRARASALSVNLHWTLIFAVTPILVALCYLTYSHVEEPGTNSVNRVMARLRQLADSRVRSRPAPDAPGP